MATKKCSPKKKFSGEEQKKGSLDPECLEKGPIQQGNQPEELPNSEPPGNIFP
jgi:hypothetical protein